MGNRTKTTRRMPRRYERCTDLFLFASFYVTFFYDQNMNKTFTTDRDKYNKFQSAFDQSKTTDNSERKEPKPAYKTLTRTKSTGDDDDDDIHKLEEGEVYDCFPKIFYEK